MAPDPDPKDIITAAKRANAHDMILGLQDGYDTVLRADALVLSGGQQQRIALARAVFGDPAVLVLDEPNSALDSAGSEALNRTIADFRARQRSVILMTHRPQALAACDRLIVIDGGIIRADGPRDEIIQSILRPAPHAPIQGTPT